MDTIWMFVIPAAGAVLGFWLGYLIPALGARRGNQRAISARKAQDDAERYRSALMDVVRLLEPLNSPVVKAEVPKGLEYEWNEALETAMNAIAGLDVDAHYEEFRDSEGTVLPAKYSKVEIEAAWRAAGFEQDRDDPKIWRVGTAVPTVTLKDFRDRSVD